MRVLRVLGNLDPAVGGPPVSSVNACLATARAGVEITALVPVSGGGAAGGAEAARPAVERLEQAGIAVNRFTLASMPRRAALRWAISWPLARWLRRNGGGFDAVHCHGAWQLGGLVAALPGMNAVPRVLTPHESLTRFDIDQTSSPLNRLAKELLKPAIVAGYRCIVMSSALEARDSLAGAARAKAAIVPHPVYDESRHSVPNARRGDGGMTIGFLGRLHPKKNLDLLIAALADLPGDVRLVVGGDGPAPLAQLLRRQAAEQGVDRRIDWLGFVTEGDKAAFFAAIDVLAMPSAYECFGMAAAEAIVHGVPVLVSRDSGIADIVAAHGCGEVVEASRAAIAHTLGTLYGRPDRVLMQAAATPLAAAASLSFGAHGAAMARLYRTLIASAA